MLDAHGWKYQLDVNNTHNSYPLKDVDDIRKPEISSREPTNFHARRCVHAHVGTDPRVYIMVATNKTTNAIYQYSSL